MFRRSPSQSFRSRSGNGVVWDFRNSEWKPIPLYARGNLLVQLHCSHSLSLSLCLFLSLLELCACSLLFFLSSEAALLCCLFYLST